MIGIPITCDVIARITWRGISAIQRINLGDYPSLMAKMPKGTRIDVLSYLGNREYGFTMLTNVTVDKDDYTHMNYTTTNYKGLNLYTPNHTKFTLVPCTADKFERPITLESYLLSLLPLRKVKTLRIEQGKRVFNDLWTYMRKKDPDVRTKVFINDKPFDWFSYLDKQLIYDYLTEYYSNKMDVYLTHLMTRSGFLAPVVFSGLDLSGFVIDGKLRVPLENYWIFYLMYGRQYEVISQLDDCIFSAADLKLNRIHKTYLREPIAMLHIDSKNNRPVVVNGLFPMRFR